MGFDLTYVIAYPGMANDIRKLAGVKKVVGEKALAVLGECWKVAKPMRVVFGYRSPALQNRLYQQGRTTPGKIVTNLDGYRHPSMHNLGRAVDACAWRGGTFDWNAPSDWWSNYGVRGEKRGMRWGGRWRMRDLGHLEL